MQKCVVFAIPTVEKSTKKASDMETKVLTEAKYGILIGKFKFGINTTDIRFEFYHLSS
jgi:hypothetical protein